MCRICARRPARDGSFLGYLIHSPSPHQGSSSCRYGVHLQPSPLVPTPGVVVLCSALQWRPVFGGAAMAGGGFGAPPPARLTIRPRPQPHRIISGSAAFTSSSRSPKHASCCRPSLRHQPTYRNLSGAQCLRQEEDAEDEAARVVAVAGVEEVAVGRHSVLREAQ